MKRFALTAVALWAGVVLNGCESKKEKAPPSKNHEELKPKAPESNSEKSNSPEPQLQPKPSTTSQSNVNHREPEVQKHNPPARIIEHPGTPCAEGDAQNQRCVLCLADKLHMTPEKWNSRYGNRQITITEPTFYQAWRACGGPSKVPPSNIQNPCKTGMNQQCEYCLGNTLGLTYQQYEQKMKGKQLLTLLKDSQFKKAWISCGGPLQETDKIPPPTTRNPCKQSLQSQECVHCMGNQLGFTYTQFVSYTKDVASGRTDPKKLLNTIITCGGRNHLSRDELTLVGSGRVLNLSRGSGSF